MKKINKIDPPNELTVFSKTQPRATWNNFYQYDSSREYNKLKKNVFSTQKYLCAYCEVYINPNSKNHQRIEHFHSKSDTSNPAKNWALDWFNIFGVCMGGVEELSIYPLPDNLSCDSHKSLIEEKMQKPVDWSKQILNPLHIKERPLLFGLHLDSGELAPDADNCALSELEGTVHDSTEDFVQKTIDTLNLNCDRLKENRKRVFNFYQKKLYVAKKKKDRDFKKKLAKSWFHSGNTEFYTTKRIILGSSADAIIFGA